MLFRIIIPLLKHELWSSIVTDTSKRSRFCITIDNRSLAKRANRKRYIFNGHGNFFFVSIFNANETTQKKIFHFSVTMESSSPKVFIGDFVLIESNDCPSFFAYVTGQQFTSKFRLLLCDRWKKKIGKQSFRHCISLGNGRITYFTLEASETVVNFTSPQPTSFYATPIANIRSELKQFSAILYLEKTPFKDMIINPVKNPLPDPRVQIEGFIYTGYVWFFLVRRINLSF